MQARSHRQDFYRPFHVHVGFVFAGEELFERFGDNTVAPTRQRHQEAVLVLPLGVV